MLPPTMTRQSILGLNETMTIVTRDYSPYSYIVIARYRLEGGAMNEWVASAANRRLAHIGARVVARVPESLRATDLVIAFSTPRLGVVRCVEVAKPEDHSALATMLAEGDFVWAGIVYRALVRSQAEGFVETFHVSDLDRLGMRLSELREAFDEAR